jgi:hypothetical protein
LGLVPEEPGPPGEIAGQRELLSRLRAVVEAKDAENAVLRAELDAERELSRRLELRLAELERRLSMDSSDPALPRLMARRRAHERRSEPLLTQICTIGQVSVLVIPATP